MSSIERPFGAWESPITSKSITTGSVKFGGLTFCGGKLYLLESRPQEGGRNVLCLLQENGDKVDVTPTTSNVRTRVHEYGGGAYTIGDNQIYFSEFTTQQLCRLDDGTATPLTFDENRFRFADGDIFSTTMYCVQEDHLHSEPSKVVNQVVQVDLSLSSNNNNNDEEATIATIATGKDFYAAPRVSSDGNHVAYICWDHPNMPWDATQLRVARSDGDTSILQPQWHPIHTSHLYYLSDQSGHYNIYKYDTTTKVSNCVLPMPHDFGGAAPGWSLGQQGFRFLSDGRLVATYSKEGKSVLLVATLPSSDGSSSSAANDIQEYGMDDGLPMQFGSVVPGDDGDHLYFVGGSPSTPTSIYQWNLKQRQPGKILACSSTLAFDSGMISTPQQIEFPTTNSLTAFGYYYPPQNSNYHAPSDTMPPLLVKAHGGPTACTSTMFNAGIQFWTSRGFAVLDVDYGGSTGYGRDYRRRLRKSWGIVDIDDVCAGAEYLVQQNKANPKQLCIDGGSAGRIHHSGCLGIP